MSPRAFCADVKVERLQNYKQEVAPELFDNYLFSTFFTNSKSAYNLRGYKIASVGGEILDIKVNPAGYSYILLYGKPGKTKVSIHQMNEQDNKKIELTGLIAPTAVCYSPDSRHIFVADNGKIKSYNSKSNLFESEFSYVGTPSMMVYSPNGYFLAIVDDGKVNVINANTGAIRTTIPINSPVSVSFSPTSSLLGILNQTGDLLIYNTSDFGLTQTINGLGNTTSLFFHPDDNYAGMVSDHNRIQFVNLFDSYDRPTVYDANVSSARFLKDGMNNLYVASVSPSSIKYRQIGGFVPNYGMQLNLMVEERMREWTKMRPGETELEYQERVNEESIKKQRQLFMNDAATELALASGLGAFSDITLGRYNPTDGTLIISLNGLNDIYLKVPPEDMAGFGDGNNLQFSNQVYSVTQNNTFELIYVQVYNPTNTKTYVFDNLDKQNLDFLNIDDGFVSLDLIRQSAREDVILKGIKDEIIKQAKDARLLSDHTSVNVETHIESGIDADGKRVKNYHVDFTYQVDAAGSATEDFPPGKYKISESPAASSLIKIINQAFSTEFSSYIVPGKQLIIEITGSADALPINGSIGYDNSFGEISNEPCYIDNNLTSMTVSQSAGIRNNEQLAYMRAKAVQNEMEHLLTNINSMNTQYKHLIEVSKEKGAQFRRINVSLIFIDAL